LDCDPINWIWSDIINSDLDIGCGLSNDSSKSIAKCLIKLTELINEVEVPILERANLCHEVLIMVCSKAEGMQTK
jgi:hypothetical protein